MKYLHEYRNPALAQKILAKIQATTTRPWVLMEVCGGQTHSIIRHGLDRLLPDSIELIHGPGCPVCVTPTHCIDEAISIADSPNVIFCTFADMLRVPGNTTDLLAIKAHGADVRSVYSPMDAVAIASKNPDREVVFFAVGFETTAPANALSVLQARAKGLRNFSLLVSQVLVPPAIEAIVESPDNRVQGFLAAGHVCTVMGYQQYQSLSKKHHIPIVVTGFEPLDLLLGIEACIAQLEQGQAQVENRYNRLVQPGGNPNARAALDEVFSCVDHEWRGLGTLTASGLELRDAYSNFDARQRFPVLDLNSTTESTCLAGHILTGKLRPDQCPQFGKACTPDNPLGATMVSSEGACAAYFKYRPRGGEPLV